MTSTFKPRTAALFPVGVMLVTAALSQDVLAASSQPEASAPAEPAPEAAPAETPAEPVAAEPAPAQPEPAPAQAGVQAGASAGDGKASVGAKTAAPKASKSGRRQAPAGVVLDEKTGKVRDTRKWIHRYSPERHMIELGVFGGVYLPPDDHDLFQPDPADRFNQEQKPLWRLGGLVGGRLAYFPLRVLGFEFEGGVSPTFVRNSLNERALVYGIRGHAIVQLPYRFTPFLLGGYGALGISSDRDRGLGSDLDRAGHWGGGVKLYVNRMLAVRAEARHLISAQAYKARPEFTSHVEVMLGLSLVLGRVRPQPAPKDLDWDKDGIQNDVDQCPKLAGLPPDGCPAIDSDNDTFLDKVDKCPFEAGVAPDGCPPPDTDKDGIIDADDQCPTEPWPEPPGCPPPPDQDGDKIIDKDDTCPLHPESYNGYQDTDGCPDTLPEKAKIYDGRPLEGIFFETKSDKIKKNSTKVLDRVVEVLKEFKDLKIEISGHTDDVGSDDFNLDLSQRRADAVKKYLVDKGVEEGRITTIGYGKTKPIDPGTTSKARAKNRRIEFRVIIDRPTGATSSPESAGPDGAAPPAGGK